VATLSEARAEPSPGPKAVRPRSDDARPEHDVRRANAANEIFRRVSHKAAWEVGRPWAFGVALATIVTWAVTGPLFHYSDTWQLVINTGTTIVTFLMVFLIQNTQNRDTHELQLKLDELIRANRRARNRMMGLEDLTDEEIDELEREFRRMAEAKLREHARSSRPSGNAGS
jgi:low affinity Fe/Cu permease